MGVGVRSRCEIVRRFLAVFFFLVGFVSHHEVQAIRFPELQSREGAEAASTATAVFAMGSFWRGEAVFGCLPGVVRTRVGYAGGTKVNPDYRNIGNHAEAVEVEYLPSTIRYEELLDVFWANHDPSQTFGQGPDVGDQYRSMIFTQDDDEDLLATVSMRREQNKLGDVLVVTKVASLKAFYPAESDHQKFELKRNPSLLQHLGELSEAELMESTAATKLNSYAAKLCPKSVQKLIESNVGPVIKSRPKLLQVFGD